MQRGKLTQLIENNKHAEETPRNYIGASSIGSECLRQIWYEYKGEKGEEIPNKLKRTWDIGKILEKYVVDLLRQLGLNILTDDLQVYFGSDKDNTFSMDWTEFSDPMVPYFKGHCDGLILDYKAILEIKTAKDSSFKQFVNEGCKKWNPKYYAQLQTYMGMSGINSSYILVLNKDNSDLFDELVSFDADFYHLLREKAKMIHEAQIPPPRINGSPLFYMCRMCQFRKVCHE